MNYLQLRTAREEFQQRESWACTMLYVVTFIIFLAHLNGILTLRLSLFVHALSLTSILSHAQMVLIILLWSIWCEPLQSVQILLLCRWLVCLWLSLTSWKVYWCGLAWNPPTEGPVLYTNFILLGWFHSGQSNIL